MTTTTIAGKIGRTRMMLLILGALVSSVIAFSVVGNASATHSCPDSLHTAEECIQLTDLAINEALAEALVAYNDWRELYAATPFLTLIICDPALTNDESHAVLHVGDFDFEGAILRLMSATRAKRRSTSPEAPLIHTWGTEIRQAPANRDNLGEQPVQEERG